LVRAFEEIGDRGAGSVFIVGHQVRIGPERDRRIGMTEVRGHRSLDTPAAINADA
jgi:hypothetical protein